MTLGNPDRAIGGLAVRTPPGIELRPLGRDDLAVAVAMAREQRDLPPLDDAAALRPRYETLVNSPDVAPFLALDGTEPVGLLVVQFRRRLNFATFEGWISDLYVCPPSRGRGLGRALVEAALAEWRLRGGHRLQVQVPDGATAARATLDRAGFEEWMLDFRLAPVRSNEEPPPEGATIRPLGSADGDAVTRLIAEFGPQRSPVPDRMEAVLRTFAAHVRAVDAGDAASVVAELDGVTVGVCTLEWRRPFWDTALHAWIPDLVVTEPVRGRGIGRALLQHALGLAVAAGGSEAALESGPHRESAQRLYRAAGFAQTGRTHVIRRDA